MNIEEIDDHSVIKDLKKEAWKQQMGQYFDLLRIQLFCFYYRALH